LPAAARMPILEVSHAGIDHHRNAGKTVMKTLFRALIVLFAFVLLVPGAALAQAKGDVEIFFGVNYLSPSFEGLEAIAPDKSLDMWGIHGDVTYYLTDSLGIVLDGSFPRTELDLSIPLDGAAVPVTVDYSQATYMAGPRMRFNAGGAITPSIQGLIGWSSGSIGQLNLEGVDVPVLVNLGENSFAASVGANLDVRLGSSFALRLLQASLVFTSFGDTSQTTGRFSAGLVGRF
jgi:hypothetical protein